MKVIREYFSVKIKSLSIFFKPLVILGMLYTLGGKLWLFLELHGPIGLFIFFTSCYIGFLCFSWIAFFFLCIFSKKTMRFALNIFSSLRTLSRSYIAINSFFFLFIAIPNRIFVFHGIPSKFLFIFFLYFQTLCMEYPFLSDIFLFHYSLIVVLTSFAYCYTYVAQCKPLFDNTLLPGVENDLLRSKVVPFFYGNPGTDGTTVAAIIAAVTVVVKAASEVASKHYATYLEEVKISDERFKREQDFQRALGLPEYTPAQDFEARRKSQHGLYVHAARNKAVDTKSYIDAVRRSIRIPLPSERDPKFVPVPKVLVSKAGPVQSSEDWSRSSDRHSARAERLFPQGKSRSLGIHRGSRPSWEKPSVAPNPTVKKDWQKSLGGPTAHSGVYVDSCILHEADSEDFGIPPVFEREDSILLSDEQISSFF